MSARPQLRYCADYEPGLTSLVVDTGYTISAGDLVVAVAGLARPASTATGQVAIGIAAPKFYSITGDGTLRCDVLRGVFGFASGTAGDAITVANRGAACYHSNTTTVNLTSAGGTRSLAGEIVDVVGSTVYVKVGGLGASAIASMALITHSWAKSLRKDSDDATAGTATAEAPFALAEEAGTITAINYAGGAVTANDTDYATITIARRRAGSSVTIKAVTTKIAGGLGNITAFVPIDFGTLANTGLLANDVLTLTIAKAGAGVVIPAGVFTAVLSKP